jgi:hypothetical protein
MGCNCGKNKKKRPEATQEVLASELPGNQLKALKAADDLIIWKSATLVKLPLN